MPQYIQTWNLIGSGHMFEICRPNIPLLVFTSASFSFYSHFFVGGFCVFTSAPLSSYSHFLLGGSWVFATAPFSSYSHFLVGGFWVFTSAPFSSYSHFLVGGSWVFASAPFFSYSHFLIGGFWVFASAPFPSYSPFSCWLVFNIGKNDLSKAFDDVENQSIGDGGARRSWKCFFTDLTLINYLHLKIAHIQVADSNIFGGAISDAIPRHPNRRHFGFTYLSIYEICLPK